MNEVVAAKRRDVTGPASKEQVFVTIYIDEQLFGIPVERVRDILLTETIADVPLAPTEVIGMINLRGRIVTVIDVRRRLGIPPLDEQKKMCTTIEQGNELYSLLIDNIGAVIPLPLDKVEKVPNNLDPRWKSVASGVVRLEEELMVVLDIDALLDIS